MATPPARSATAAGSSPGAAPGSRWEEHRSRHHVALSGGTLAERYRRIYTAAFCGKEQEIPAGRGRKAFSKIKLKRHQKVKQKFKTRAKADVGDGVLAVPHLKLHSNPSAFSVYCSVRLCVLEWQQRAASLGLDSTRSGESDSEDDEEGWDPPAKLPKIIGIGLRGVFELLKETRFSHPSLCLRSLHALLDILQGQQPEAFQAEPPDALESLFYLLLDITAQSVDASDPASQALVALSCSCLFSLVVCWGDTGKTLKAVAAILTGSSRHASHSIQVPTILEVLQRSVQAVLAGRVQVPDWFSSGVKRSALLSKWVVTGVSVEEDENCVVQTDGSFLYLLCKDGLYKVGSGYSSTVQGHVYNTTSRIRNHEGKMSWLGFAQGSLFYRELKTQSVSAVRINPETLDVEGNVMLPGAQGDSILFTDGECINQIAACRDEGFVVRIYGTCSDPTPQQELQLKLARKCLHACGISLFDLEKDLHVISTGFEEEATLIGAGREFALMRTASGKVYYTGKYQILGIKQGGPPAGKWAELPLPKSPKIVQFSVGHDGSHALLVAEDGGVFFTGLASKGEDGESTKSRRQAKPYKPKKMAKLEAKTAVQSACNNGSSSVVTGDGELYVFGKDAVYCDGNCQVTDLKGQFVTQVAMGKAHTCVLTKSGEVWTFGVNNKGQCGRDTGGLTQSGKAQAVDSVATAMEQDLEEELQDLEDQEGKPLMCPLGAHIWRLEQCMVCTVCGDCTGYGASCVSSSRPGRVPGGICGCGSGDSGCAACGCCKACAQELNGQDAHQRGDLVKEMVPLDLLLGVNIEDHIQVRQQGKRQQGNRRQRLEEVRDGSGDRSDRDSGKITTYPPGAVHFGCELCAVQVSCGSHHSVVLMENGSVFTFGYGQHGQLGHGDTGSRGSPTLVQTLPGCSIQVTAGSNHTVVLLMDGQVCTFGSFSKGQLGRPILDVPYWNAKPSLMPNIGAKCGRKATWVGASGDQTFLRIDEALINSHILATSEIFANKHIIGLVPTAACDPPPFKCLLINKTDGSCRTFGDSKQEDLQGFGICLDPEYNVIWRFLPASREVCCYHVVMAEMRAPPASSLQMRCSILSPQLALPTGSNAISTCSHGALHILGCLDALAATQELKAGTSRPEEETQAVVKVYSKEDYSVVNRFESHGGGWGYSAHSVEAVRFCADTDILLGGLGLFGGRGEYTAKIKLFELGPDGGDHEADGDLLAETDVLAYDCAAREKYAMMFEEPVPLQPGWWYVAWARVSGPSSDCGSHGQSTITTDDGVIFQFKSSKKSNNGTDVNAGQIPQLLYRLPTDDGDAAKGQQPSSEPVRFPRPSFARAVSAECFESLLEVLHWSWNALVQGAEELRSLRAFQYRATLLDLERLHCASAFCLRLLRIYICDIFPVSASAKVLVEESGTLAECVGQTRSLLREILSEGVDSRLTRLDNDPQGSRSRPLALLEAILQECHCTFTACFHAFYPTPALQWACLCDLLTCLDQDVQDVSFRSSGSRLLAAVMSALCDTSVKLTSILPIARDSEVMLRSLDKRVGAEKDSTLSQYFPLLVTHMEKLSHSEKNLMGLLSFREVLQKMLLIVALPVRRSLRKEAELFSPQVVSSTCSLLARIVSELTASALSPERDALSLLHSVKTTPNRFARSSQGRSWNTGNGSPDAICFSVDRPGVVLIGLRVYGGGGVHEYEVEMLSDDAQVEHLGEASHSQRWMSLEMTKGTYSIDDSSGDIAEIRFERAVALKENVKYAVCLRNYGSRTASGDGGVSAVQCSDGVTFTFSTCSLSSNGTNQSRGQIPQLLYYRAGSDGDLQSQQLSKAAEEDSNCCRALSVVSAVVQASKDLLHRALAVDGDDIPELLSSSSLFFMLLPHLLAYIGPVAASAPKVAVEVFGLVQELLPTVSALNQKYVPPAFNPNQSTDSATGVPAEQGLSTSTTSSHYAVVESEHPYKPSGVTHYKVTFSNSVRWMTLEFDPQCGTAQPEDVLRLLIPSRSLVNSSSGPRPSGPEAINAWTELRKFSGSSGWPNGVLVFPGSEVLFSLETTSDYVKDEKSCFFGFKCIAVGYEFSPGPDEGIVQLEKELAYLGSVCAAALMKKDLALPTENELEEDLEILEEASLQVCKAHAGLLGKGLSLSHSPSILEALEGNLPLQLQSNELSFLEDFIACVPNSSGGRLARWLQPDSYADPQKTSVILNKDDICCGQPTTMEVKTKDQYGDVVHVPNMKVEVKAVPLSRMKSVQEDCGRTLTASPFPVSNLTFGGLPTPKLEANYEPMIIKEARYVSITMMKAYENYSFEELRFASPSPKRPSESMLIRANADGTYTANWTPGTVGLYAIRIAIDCIEIDTGLEVEVKEPPKGSGVLGTRSVKPKAEARPSKVCSFVSKDSAGLRVRSRPSLQSEQIGVVHVDGAVEFTDEIRNDDGVWVRLSEETLKMYVSNMNGCTEAWCLSYNQQLGRSLLVSDDVTSAERIQVQLDNSNLTKFCKNDVGEALSFAQKAGGNQRLWHEEGNSGTSSAAHVMSITGNNRPMNQSEKMEASGSWMYDQDKAKSNENIMASEALILKSETAKLRSDSPSRSHSPNHNTLQAFKTDGRTSDLREESPAPGFWSSSPNRKGFFSGKSSLTNASLSRSSSPNDKNLPQDLSPSSKVCLDPLRESSKSNLYNLDPKTLQKKKVSPTDPLRGRSSSLKVKILSKDCKGGKNSENHVPSPHTVQENLHSTVVEVCTSNALLSHNQENVDENAKVLGTEQDFSELHFSIGRTPAKQDLETRTSPKVSRKTSRHIKPKNDKSGTLFKGDSAHLPEPSKQAMSPSVAECARAVFAAFLWHEGIVHDAMACSSYLKFNPELTKEHTPIHSSLTSQQATDKKEGKAKNRHSLELSSSLNMFNISPHGPNISKMGSLNKNKVLSMLKELPLPERCEDGKMESTASEVTGNSSVRGNSILPLTLQYLVAFWEDISTAAIKAATQNMIFHSPGSSVILRKKEMEKDDRMAKKEKMKKVRAEVRPRGNLIGEMAQQAGGGPEKDTICELCGESHPYPVTYHMRQAHAGCGRYAGGQGYNSIGHFCGGWAGNCGDGGIGGSTWYLICDQCREKYLKEKQTATKEKVKQPKKKPLAAKPPRALPTMEAHQVIRANALFLLSLNSAAKRNCPYPQPERPLRAQLAGLREDMTEERTGKMGCLYLQVLARQHMENYGAYQDDSLFPDDMRYLRSMSGSMPNPSVTPDACPVFEEPESNTKSTLLSPRMDTDTDTSKRTGFHRSYSVVASEYEKQRSASPADFKVLPRRRVHSGDADMGSSLLRHPSPELSRLISTRGSMSEGGCSFQWPVLAFVIQHHDLEGLEVAMKHALRKSACRVFAMEAFNWLLCNVIQMTSLHDIMWHFVASLTPSPCESEEDEEEDVQAAREKAEQERDLGVCVHPLSDITVAGEATQPLLHTFHRLLQTISDLMMFLPSGSSLQQMALRCWSLKFKQSDHQFLHQSNVFHHINNILSKSDDGDSEESFNISMQSTYEVANQGLCMVTSLKDLTSVVDIKTSSRPAMIGSLIDGSTETFWESGDEDKNKIKSISISCVKTINPSIVSIHVDNSRDTGNKVMSVAFLCGRTVDDLCRIKQVDLDSRHTGWVTSELPVGSARLIRIELKGPENTLRVRQVKVLGWKEGESIKIPGQISASVAQQRSCEVETLRVFRLITSQVFGKLISGDAEPSLEQGEKNLLSSPEGVEKVQSDADLKEHMVGIIFSRSKLTNLQKQVCSHIVRAIRTEAARVREEWEHAISSRENANSQPSEEDTSSDIYCFELLSMVLALSGSNVGRRYLAHQPTLLQDLFSLLHTASPRVQRQVTALLRRVLPEVTPARLANVIGVKVLPPADISDIIHSMEKGDWTRTGIADLFLGCIAKALTVQIKAKGAAIVGTSGTSVGKGITTVTLPMVFNSNYIRRGESDWWMKGSMPPQIAEIIIKLVKDMAAGHLSDGWSRVTKNAIAETIIALTKVEEEHRAPARCIATTRLWLALASLCVLDQDHVDRLSSGHWNAKDGQQKQMPLCDNHDDGETCAIIWCSVCGNLCTDCDRFLHLHRRTRSHQRQVFKEEEEAIKVDLHEGCGRIKLFWLMALADSKTMKVMVEFREHTGKVASSSSEACRFCGTRSGAELSAVGSVCSDPDCQEYAKLACRRTHPCGHPCGGVKDELSCLPCLHGCDKSATCLKQDADDMCMICFTEALSAAPAIQLDCTHVFHLQCTRRVLENRWLGPRISFGFMSCPICKNNMNHFVIQDLLEPITELYDDVRRKALMRLEYEGLHKSEAITTPGTRFYDDPAGFAMNRYAYYVCFKCKKAYFGGEARCDVDAGHEDNYDPQELICGGCSDVSRAQMCTKHGMDFLEYKCRYCCSVAVFFCFGTTHFCNACHEDFQRITSIPKEELPHCPAGPKGKQLEGNECPLHMVHPATGEEFALGCGVCRNTHTF